MAKDLEGSEVVTIFDHLARHDFSAKVDSTWTGMIALKDYQQTVLGSRRAFLRPVLPARNPSVAFQRG